MRGVIAPRFSNGSGLFSRMPGLLMSLNSVFCSNLALISAGYRYSAEY